MLLTHIAQRETKLLSILRQELAMSSTLVKRLKYCHAYRVNGEMAFTNYPVKPGDCIQVILEEPQPVYPSEDAPLEILYEDEALIALDKPVGMLVHPSSARNTGTLANRIIAYYSKTGQTSAVHPISRLDRDTYGVVLLAKHSHIHALMHRQSMDGAIQKCYHAAVFGSPPADEGIIDAPIARLSQESMLRCIRQDGKPSRSHYRVLDRAGNCSLLELQPLTGRTHQLRLHCAYLGCPILGDPQYGTEEAHAFSLAHGLKHQFLCAHSLRFNHPLTEKSVEISSKYTVSLDF